MRILKPRLEKASWYVFLKNIYLEIILNLQKNYNNSTYNICVSFTQNLLTFRFMYFIIRTSVYLIFLSHLKVQCFTSHPFAPKFFCVYSFTLAQYVY